ncbi:MAG TPA: multiheme c-type cytochrome [Terriglobales bacterium]|nr:multiheme c-type cytochrome [Terriglobales bacterium]
MNLQSIKMLQVGLLVANLAIGVADSQDDKGARFSMATPDRWKAAGWWPTKGTPSVREYVGPEACTRCHSEIAASQQKTPMFNAARLPSDSIPLRQHQKMSFSDETYNYVLLTGPTETRLSIKDKTNTASGTVGWVFGAGEVAQTYILKRNDSYWESRLSYYPSLAGLDITPGHKADAPNTIAQALGDPVDDETIRRCFGCHSTASTVSGNFDPEHAMLGVTCEACHGPGLQHVTAMETAPDPGATGTMLNPRRLSPVDSVDFCGACHRTPVDVAVFMPRHMGISSIRFQPYRLERSLCWGAGGDSRITCMACHDPHKPLVRDSAAYDAKCLKCHSQLGSQPAAQLAPACTVGTKDCTSCHMPKYEIRWVHGTFTDHFIRVVRPDSGFRE